MSFPPGADPIPLTALNVIVGPNGSGKSNLIEGLDLLRATPTGFANAIRDGGGAREWLWKGEGRGPLGTIEALVHKAFDFPNLRYRLSFTASGQRTEVIDEAIENEKKSKPSEKDVFFYYRFNAGNAIINVRELQGKRSQRHLERASLLVDESVLSQRKDPISYPELTWLGQQFGRIQPFREWSFGRYGLLRQPQPADLPSDTLLPDARNLGSVLNQVEHSAAYGDFNKYLSRFLPRFNRFSVRIEGGTVQFYLHEDGLKLPVPATRLSDGTIRFMAILAQLLSPLPPPLICMEEPELGLHPDAVSLLAGLLNEASSRTQLVVTTHSDSLISALTEYADSVLVCEYHAGTTLKRLDSSKLRYWLDRYRLGEIWRIGEIGGNL